MERKHFFTPLFLGLTGLFIFVLGGIAATAFIVPVEAQSPPDFLFELPMINLHSSAADATGGYSSVPLTIDINSDARPDLVMSALHPNSGAWNQYVYLNTGNGFDLVYECYRADWTSDWTGDCDYRN